MNEDEETNNVLQLGGVLGNTITLNGEDIVVTTTYDSIYKPNTILNPETCLHYSKLDVDKLIMMLTLWIDDRTVRDKIEEMYRYWKDLQK